MHVHTVFEIVITEPVYNYMDASNVHIITITISHMASDLNQCLAVGPIMYSLHTQN